MSQAQEADPWMNVYTQDTVEPVARQDECTQDTVEPVARQPVARQDECTQDTVAGICAIKTTTSHTGQDSNYPLTSV